MMNDMELATVTSRGQITLPSPVRKKLGVAQGSKVVFFEEHGRMFVENANMLELRDRSMEFTTEELVDFSNQQAVKLHEGDEW